MEWSGVGGEGAKVLEAGMRKRLVGSAQVEGSGEKEYWGGVTRIKERLGAECARGGVAV